MLSCCQGCGLQGGCGNDLGHGWKMLKAPGTSTAVSDPNLIPLPWAPLHIHPTCTSSVSLTGQWAGGGWGSTGGGVQVVNRVQITLWWLLLLLLTSRGGSRGQSWGPDMELGLGWLGWGN